MDADGGDQMADEMKNLTLNEDTECDDGALEDDSQASEKKPSVSMRNMHFTNGDWYPEEKPRLAPPPDTGTLFEFGEGGVFCCIFFALCIL